MDDFSFGTITGEGQMGEAVFSGRKPFARFFAHSVPVPFQSQAEGRPVFRKLHMVELMTPGERDTCVSEVKGWHKDAFRPQWEAYQAGQEQTADGTLLAVLFPSNPEIVDMLRAQKVHTVEQLANLSDGTVQTMGLGGAEFRAKAVRFLEQAEKAAGFGRVEAAEKAVADMQAEMARMREELAAAKAASPAPADVTPPTPPVEPLRRKAAPTAA